MQIFDEDFRLFEELRVRSGRRWLVSGCTPNQLANLPNNLNAPTWWSRGGSQNLTQVGSGNITFTPNLTIPSGAYAELYVTAQVSASTSSHAQTHFPRRLTSWPHSLVKHCTTRVQTAQYLDSLTIN